MMRLQRNGRMLRWTGAVLSLLMLAGWAFSTSWECLYLTSRGTTPGGLALVSGWGCAIGCLVYVEGPATKFPTNRGNWRICLSGFRVQLLPFVDMDSGALGLPLWVQFLVVAIPTRSLWRRGRPRNAYCRKCWAKVMDEPVAACPRCGGLKFVQARYPAGVSFLVAVVPFAFLFLVARQIIWMAAFRAAGFQGFGGGFHLIQIIVPVVLGYLPSRMIYRRLRWRPFERDAPRCARCAYNLTGNTSGICPECGERIEERAHATL